MRKSIQKNRKFRTKYLILFLFFLVWDTHALDAKLKTKYPFLLVNNDHDILNEKILADDSYGRLAPVSIDGSQSKIYDYWKCYETKNITITYDIMEYRKEWGEDVADFNINAIDDGGKVNQYGMRHGMGVTFCKQTSKIWKNMMKNQKHVCLYGSYTGSNEELYNGKKQLVIGWVFNKLKTKNSCYNYFSSRDCYGNLIKSN